MKCPHCGKELSEESFKIHWMNKKESIIKGFDIEDAFRKAGFGGGILKAVDYWEEVESD